MIPRVASCLTSSNIFSVVLERIDAMYKVADSVSRIDFLKTYFVGFSRARAKRIINIQCLEFVCLCLSKIRLDLRVWKVKISVPLQGRTGNYYTKQ